MARFVSLLKGINVGGKNIIAMKEVVRLHEQLGLSDVRSYLQSGSICFSSQEGDEGKIERKIKAALSEAMGRDISVVIRSGADMKSILRRNPYPKETEREPNRVFVGFLSAKPTRDAVSVLGEFVSPGERFIVHGTEMYLH